MRVGCLPMGTVLLLIQRHPVHQDGYHRLCDAAVCPLKALPHREHIAIHLPVVVCLTELTV